MFGTSVKCLNNSLLPQCTKQRGSAICLLERNQLWRFHKTPYRRSIHVPFGSVFGAEVMRIQGSSFYK